MMKQTDFITACLSGQAVPSELGAFVERWHTEQESPKTLQNYLGVTDAEYSFMTLTPDSSVRDVLYCRTYGIDISTIWNKDSLSEYNQLVDAIDTLKESFKGQWRWTNAHTHDQLVELGRLITEKNRLTGLKQDIGYLYSDDREWARYVAGFIGDETGLKDIHGTHLLIGDTITLTDEDGITFDRMIISHGDDTYFFKQEQLAEGKAEKKNSFIGDLESSSCAAFTITVNSCRQNYIKAWLKQQDTTGIKSLCEITAEGNTQYFQSANIGGFTELVDLLYTSRSAKDRLPTLTAPEHEILFGYSRSKLPVCTSPAMALFKPVDQEHFAKMLSEFQSDPAEGQHFGIDYDGDQLTYSRWDENELATISGSLGGIITAYTDSLKMTNGRNAFLYSDKFVQALQNICELTQDKQAQDNGQSGPAMTY